MRRIVLCIVLFATPLAMAVSSPESVQEEVAGPELGPSRVTLPAVPSQMPAPEDVADISLTAALEGHWSVLIAGLVLLVLLGLRMVGGSLFPGLATDLGGAALAVAAGAALTVLELLQHNKDPTLAMVLVAAASGLWSWARKLGLVGLVLRVFGHTPVQSPSAPPSQQQ